MKFGFTKETSRLKKKLLLYFLLIAIVSISVSVEIIFEMSEPKFRNDIKSQFYNELEKNYSDVKFQQVFKDIKDKDALEKDAGKRYQALDNIFNENKIFKPIFKFRNRMILLLLVITGSIISAFFLFTKDIVSPMDGMVDATRRIVDGDLTIKVPVLTNDEIGMIGMHINAMNVKLLDMIVQVKQDLGRHKDKISTAIEIIKEQTRNMSSREIAETKRIKISDFRKIMELGENVISLLNIMTEDLTSMQTFVNMYKTYSLTTELTQEEIENALNNYEKGIYEEDKEMI
jgi:methyl-accepting chemotaxis protein